MNQFVSALSSWWKAPFSPDMDVWHVFLLTGLVLVSIVLWLMVLSHLRNVKLG